jgi:cysteine desulfurase
MIYLDHNATTAVPEEVVAEMVDALKHAWANPSSTHGPGQTARRTLADARARVASFFGCSGAELVFTSGASEANHMAVLGALAVGQALGRRRLVLSAVEHPGLLALAQRLASEGVGVDLIPVDAQGQLNLQAARALITREVALVSVMGANNETGVRMPLTELAALTQAAGATLHVDATQLAGKVQFHFAGSGIDLLAVSAHKIGGPKGVGALLVRKGLSLPPLLSGRQERHRRGGTENLPGIVGFAAACARTAATLGSDIEHMQALQQQLESGLLRELPGTRLYGAQAHRLPNTSCLRFGELPAEQVLTALERAGVVASSGAACSAGGSLPSHVLLAMGESAVSAKGGLRFSTGRGTTPEDIQHALQATVRVVRPLLAAARQAESELAS